MMGCLPRLESGFLLDAMQRAVARRAKIEGAKAAHGVLRGFVDEAGPEMVCGWAQDAAAPEQAVALDIMVDGRRVATVLANGYRADLRAAGMGSGCHGFSHRFAQAMKGNVVVRRRVDGAELAVTLDARRAA